MKKNISIEDVRLTAIIRVRERQFECYARHTIRLFHETREWQDCHVLHEELMKLFEVEEAHDKHTLAFCFLDWDNDLVPAWHEHRDSL